MPASPNIPFVPDLRELVIGPEVAYRLGDLIETHRQGLKPRNCAEAYLVDEMSMSHWRKLRAQIMEKAVYDRQAITWRPRDLKDSKGNSLEPFEDMYHLAKAHAGQDQSLLVALGRLETRYYRNFCTAYRLFLASRRGTPPPVNSFEDPTTPELFPFPKLVNSPATNPSKEPARCEH